MYLTPKEERMLRGEFGEHIEKAMNILTKVGEVQGASRMVEIGSAHMSAFYVIHGDPTLAFYEDVAQKGGVVSTLTTTNPTILSSNVWKYMEVPPPDDVSKQMRGIQALEKIGCLNTSSCTPYHYSNLPTPGEQVSWSESSAVVIANSVLGARANREGALSAFMAALVGRTPLYGYRLDENRVGKILVKVKAPLEGVHDLGALGFYTGIMVHNKIPVFNGVPMNSSFEGLTMLGAAAAISGALAMYHIPGLTPEARTTEMAFGGETPEDKIEVGDAELREIYEKFGYSGEIDCVFLGCPHFTLHQIGEVVRLLKGRKVHDNVKLLVTTSMAVGALARQVGYASSIRRAGGLLVDGGCNTWLSRYLRGMKIATNSAKLANNAGPRLGLHETVLGSVEDCIASAVEGRWG